MTSYSCLPLKIIERNGFVPRALSEPPAGIKRNMSHIELGICKAFDAHMQMLSHCDHARGG